MAVAENPMAQTNPKSTRRNCIYSDSFLENYRPIDTMVETLVATLARTRKKSAEREFESTVKSSKFP